MKPIEIILSELEAWNNNQIAIRERLIDLYLQCSRFHELTEIMNSYSTTQSTIHRNKA